eukprot:715278-Hanusia_phi.AAC.2
MIRSVRECGRCRPARAPGPPGLLGPVTRGHRATHRHTRRAAVPAPEWYYYRTSDKRLPYGTTVTAVTGPNYLPARP